MPKENLDPALLNKLKNLQQFLLDSQPGILAVSGGLDSRFLAHLADFWGLNYQCIFFQGPQVSPQEIRIALSFLRGLSLPFSILETNLLEQSEVAANSPERCYHCKKFLFQSAIYATASRRQPILEGSHCSDLSEHRPGHLALQELGIASPLWETRFYKNEIRKCARELGPKDPEQSSRPCLLTRFNYGYKPTLQELYQIARAEDKLAELDLQEFRIRVLANKYYLQIAHSEQDLCLERQNTIQRILDSAGLEPLEIIFTPKVSGFFDKNTPENSL